MGELENLGQKLQKIYNKAPHGCKTLQATLFGIKHAEAVERLGASKIVRATRSYAQKNNTKPIPFRYSRYLNFGKHLSDYVKLGEPGNTKGRGLPKTELRDKLTDMYASGVASRRSTVMIVLFGIKYAEDLERLKDLKKPRGREGAKYIANNFKGPKREEGSSDTSWVTEIDLGMRLAKKVRYFNRGRVKKKPM